MNFKSILAAASQRLLYLVGRTSEQLWNKQLDKLVREVGPERKGAIRTILNNFHISEVVRQGHVTAVSAPNDLDASLLNIQLNALNEMRSIDLVGFQPMQGPVSKVFNLQWKQDDKIDPAKKILSMEYVVVAAKPHTLEMKWSIEAMSDMEKIIGPSAVSEIEAASSSELALELDTLVVNDLRQASTKLDSEQISDWQTLSVILFRMANGVAQRSRRGSGNWAIMPFELVAMLQENPNYLHFPEENASGLRLMGELLRSPDAEHGIMIYSDITDGINTILVGYKGINEIDTGYVYSPYLLVVPTGVRCDEDTFEMKQNFITRGDAYMNVPENYYSSMEVLA